MRTQVTLERVKEVVENYLVEEDATTIRRKTIEFCFVWVVGSNYTHRENGKFIASDVELELAVDEYFNND